jgi:alkanesulfonate monooxygenase SsuD/methylene tetrahydromethanopterin reductase-like flavin-dependent oxidoreductase (luciferase family)
MQGFRFGVNAGANAPFAVLEQRWKLVEDLGFDNLWVADHTAGFASGGATYCYDGWTILAAMSCRTSSIRIGTLVSNPVLRPPSILARQALAVDDLSGGRLELGIGTGIAEFDHDAVGEPYWSVQERRERFAEYVDIVASILESPGPVTISGTFYKAKTLQSPQAVQRPRPPITIGGQARRVIEVAALHGDRWNTHGPAGADLDEIFDRSGRQMALLDQLARSHGRDPSTIVRSLMGVQALDVWTRNISVVEIVERFHPLGFSEFVFGWPGDDHVDKLERIARDVLPGLR